MPTSVIEHIRRVVGDGLRDGELLGRYVDRRDEAALAALVNRHGPMVWGVCRRHLSHHDAEDAFQATFIVLVRKAASIAHGRQWGTGCTESPTRRRYRLGGPPLGGGRGKCR